MKRAPNRLARSFACLALGLGILTTGSLRAQIVTLVDCPGPAAGADSTSRGFYITNYPGTSLNGTTVYMSTQSATPSQYQVALTVTEGTFDGPVVSSWFANATLSSTATAVSIQGVSPPPEQQNPSVTPGVTLCFKFGINSQPGASPTFFDVIGELGVDLPDRTDPCPNMVVTAGTNPPLSTFRREGVRLQITGNKFLNVSPGQSIQLAIDSAAPGDTVTVAPGTYVEDLTLRSDVNVNGAGPEDTILQGTGSGDVVTVLNVTNAEFSGFTVENSGTGSNDSGFDIKDSSPLIKNNIIQNNRNGIRIWGSSSGVICGNLVQDNGDDSNGFIDWGIIIIDSSTPLVSNNTVLRNEVGIYLFRPTTSGSQIVNNTVADNDGDGIWCNDSAPTIKNNLVIDNAPGISGLAAGATPELTYNNVWNNGGFGDYNAQGGAVINPGIGSISANPLVDSAFALMDGSPCIDAGDPAAIYNDLDGSRNDIGATGGPCSVAAPQGSVTVGYLWTSVGNITVNDIEQNSASDKAGLTLDRDRPFGGKPWLYGPFGVTETAVRYYAVKIGAWSGDTPPSDPAGFSYLDHALSKVRFSVSGGMIVATNTAVGPFTIGSSPPVYTHTVNSGSGYWAHENLRLVLNTLGLPNGRYDFRMEGYDLFGNLVSLSGLQPTLTLHVNNTRPVVSIDAVSFGGGAPFDECSIIDLPNETSTLDFVYTASHADGFLDEYSLDALVGRNRSGGTIVSDTYANHVAADGDWDGETLASVAATPVSPEQALPNLQLWETCAYQFRVTAWARTTNGFGRIYWTSFFDNYAIDLNPTVISTPDLDGDGDVDAQDLAIMAAAYGTP